MTERHRLLIVDDDPDFVAAIRAILDGAGYETEVAHTPRDGFAALQARRHDLLILDIMMGRGAEGVMLARKVRKDPAFRTLPILIVTGIRQQLAYLFPGTSVSRDIVSLSDLLEKPVKPETLLERVGALLGAGEPHAPGVS